MKHNKYQKKRLLFWTANSAILSAGALIITACGSGTQNPHKVSLTLPQNRTYIEEYNSTSTPAFLNYDRSASFGAFQSRMNEVNIAGLLRVQNSGAPVSKTVKLKNGQFEQVVTSPTYSKIRLELAKAIVVTTKDDKTHLFDSDEAEVKQEPDYSPLDDGQKIYFKEALYKATSNKSNSVNSVAFINALKETKKIQFVIREDATWVDNQGKPTEFKLTAEDFYYSWKRTNLVNNPISRFTNSDTSADKEKTWREILSSNDNYLDTAGGKSLGSNYNNQYLFDLFGIDWKKFDEENQFIQKVDKGLLKSNVDVNAVTFQTLNQTAGNDIHQYVTEILTNDTTFIPAPSQYIKQNMDGNKLQSENGDQSKLEAAKKIIKELPETSNSKKFGIYWYGQSELTTLQIGPYYAQGYDKQENKETYSLNQNYWDKSFVDDPNVIRTFTSIYKLEKADEKVFSKQSFQNYVNGTVSEAGYGNLDDADLNIVNSNATAYGLTQRPSKNIDSPIFRQLPKLIPVAYSGSESIDQNNPSEFYNDAYTKLLYGDTVLNIRKGDAKNTISNSFSPKAVAFRSLISAAINWQKVATTKDKSNAAISWLSRLAPDASINGRDAASGPEKPSDSTIGNITNNLRDSTNYLNTRVALLDLTNGNSKKVTSEDNDQKALTANANDQWKSAIFDEIKTAIKALLDSDNIQQNEKVKWPLVTSEFLNENDNQVIASENVVRIVKELDNRLEPTFWKSDGNRESFIQNWLPPQNKFLDRSRSGWHNDYDGIGANIDALSWSADIIPLLGVLGTKAKNNSNNANDASLSYISKVYPEIKKAASSFVDYVDKELKKDGNNQKPKLSVPVEQWDSLPNLIPGKGDANNQSNKKVSLKDALLSMKLATNIASQSISNSNGNPSLIDQTADEIKNQTYIDPYVLSSKFWLNYQTTHKNWELVKLAHELTNFMGFTVSNTMLASAKKFVPALRNPGYVFPTAIGTNFYSDWKINDQVVRTRR